MFIRVTEALFYILLSGQIWNVCSIKCWNCGYAEDDLGNRVRIPNIFQDKNISFCGDFIDQPTEKNLTKDYPNDSCCSSFKVHVVDNLNPAMPVHYLVSRHGGASDFDELNFEFKCPPPIDPIIYKKECKNETITWKEIIDGEGIVCHCNNGNLCNKDTPNITETTTISSSFSTSKVTTSNTAETTHFPSSFSTSASSKATITTISRQLIHDQANNLKEISDPILGKAELTIGVIIYLFLLRCLYSAAPPYGSSSRNLYL